MLLVLDIGNTNITAGLFNQNILNSVHSIAYDKTMRQCNFFDLLKSNIPYSNISVCAIASVSDEVTPDIAKAIKKLYGVSPCILDTKMHMDIGILSNQPTKTGIDRIANVLSAAKQYGKNAIIIDAGTATTFDILNNNNFIGGIILPGINTQFKSLAKYTSKLPEVNINIFDGIQSTINTETSNAISIGVIKGHVYSIEGLLDECIEELKETPLIIGTGGNIELISRNMKYHKFDIINKNLTLEGLKFLYDCNV